MNNNKLIYVRKIGVLADDDSRLDSMCVPAKNISEIVTAGTEIILGEDDLVVIYDEVDDTSTGEINSNYISSIVSLSINVA